MPFLHRTFGLDFHHEEKFCKVYNKGIADLSDFIRDKRNKGE
jgi:hypothetical protein